MKDGKETEREVGFYSGKMSTSADFVVWNCSVPRSFAVVTGSYTLVEWHRMSHMHSLVPTYLTLITFHRYTDVTIGRHWVKDRWKDGTSLYCI